MPLIIRHKGTKQVIAKGSPSDGSARVFEGNWYFAPDHVNMRYLKVTERTYTCPYKGVCYWIDLDTPELKARNVAWVYRKLKPGFEMIKDQIGFYDRDTTGTVAVRISEEPPKVLAEARTPKPLRTTALSPLAAFDREQELRQPDRTSRTAPTAKTSR